MQRKVEMMEVKELLRDLLPEIIYEEKKEKKETIEDIIPYLTPGTELRKGLDEILNGKTGALIVLGTNIILESIIRGGFKLNIEFTPQRLFELSKMDGAIILSSDLKRIVYANVHLMPDSKISSTETGIRHRSAEQAAKQTGLPVVAISKRRGQITLFFKDQKYQFQDINVLLTKATNSLRILQSYRQQLDSALEVLSYYELSSAVRVEDVLKILQKIAYMYKHQSELERIVMELGSEGHEIRQSMYEYMFGIERELKFLLMDYKDKEVEVKKIINMLKFAPSSELADLRKLANLLDVAKGLDLEEKLMPKGYRILSKVPRVGKATIEKLFGANLYLPDLINSEWRKVAKKAELREEHAKQIVDKLKQMYESLEAKMYKV